MIVFIIQPLVPVSVPLHARVIKCTLGTTHHQTWNLIVTKEKHKLSLFTNKTFDPT